VSDEKVVSLWGGPTGAPSVNDQCVAVLSMSLQDAEAGEVVACVVIRLHHDGLASRMTGGILGGYSILGALELAKAELVDVIREGER
jgi:hypothetical protein